MHRLKMACNLPAMVYCAPRGEEVLELDFGECKQQPSVRRKARLKRDERDENETYSMWNVLPDLLLEDIFQRLSIKERYSASQVCRNWNRIFYSRRVWNTFILHDRTLTRRKFNYYMGDQYVLDHHRTQLCLHKIARGIRSLIIKPMENFFNLYEFMTILSYYCENYEQLHLIRSLDFKFGVDFLEVEDKVFGTGGKLLQALKRLLDDMIGLKNLSLQNLLLEKEEAEYLLDDVAYNCCESLRTLRVVNCSKEPFAMLHPVVFVNLQTLTLSPQHLSDDIIEMIGNTKLKDLYLLQTKLTPHCPSVSFKSWKECRKRSPRLRVHHIMEDSAKTKVIWQDGAPVKSVIYNTPEKEVSTSCIFTTSNLYCNTLEVLAYTFVPEYSLQDAFEERADTSLMLLSKSCLYLDTLVIRDHISTATLILIAHQSHNLRRLIVRKYGLIKKCDWPHNPEWTDAFYNWLRRTSTSYEKTVQEISKMLGCKWSPLTDEEFNSFIL